MSVEEWKRPRPERRHQGPCRPACAMFRCHGSVVAGACTALGVMALGAMAQAPPPREESLVPAFGLLPFAPTVAMTGSAKLTHCGRGSAPRVQDM